jgi:predicted nucleic acid-binding protein
MSTRSSSHLPPRVIDTSVLVEWIVTPREANRRLRRELPVREKRVIPTIVQLEVAKWLARERGEAESDRVMAYLQKCDVVPLDTRIALRAAEACRMHKLPTADAVIYATAQERGVELVTCDAHFEGLPGVIYLAKSRTA